MHAHIARCSKELLGDVISPKLIPAIIQGLIIGVVLVVVEVSFASIIFSGALAPFAPRAAGMCIFGAAAFCLVTGLFSPFSTMVSLPQDTPVAILSVAAASIVAALPSVSSEIMFATVAAMVMGSALVTACFFWFIGKFRLSNIARFLPFPVIGGFLAGSGTMLLVGSFSVMTGTALSLATLPDFFMMEMFIHWGPGVFFGLLVFMLMRVKSHFLILPASMVVGMIVFLVVVVSFDISIPDIRASGWLLATMPSGGLWPGVTAETAGMIDWTILFQQLPNILTIALLSLVGVILNVNGIELGARQDIDLDQELKVEAAGNILAGLGGGFAGYGTLSLSMLGPRSNISSRIIPVTAAILCFAVLFFGANTLTFIPKPLLGGLLFLLGLFFVEEWVFSGWKRLTTSDYVIVLIIVLTIANYGFLPGVALGLGLTIVIFMVRFTHIPVLGEEKTLATLNSTRERSIPDQILISRGGQAFIILKLTGYLFFGSTYFVGKRVREIFEQKNLPEHILLDLTTVQGFDISAVNSFQRIAQQALARGVTISLAAPPRHLMDLLKRNASPEVMQQVTYHESLDHALESVENSLIAKNRDILLSNSTDGLNARHELFDAAVDNLDVHLQEQERFEKIMEKIRPYVQEKNVMQGEILVKEGKAQGSVIFVLWGSISVFITDSENRQQRLTSFGPGRIIAPGAAFAPWKSTYTAKAENQAMVAIISSKDVGRMEFEAPEKALVLYRYMTQILVKGNMGLIHRSSIHV